MDEIEGDDGTDEGQDEGDDSDNGGDDDGGGEPEPPPRPARLGARAVARAALEQVVEMTGRTPEGVTSVSRHDEGWTIEVEVVESRRIPDSADVLGVYEAELDREAELVSYRRVRRYTRGTGGEA
ncbi:hypothetical protein AD006_22845 [Pseudonocardia sp. EC080610-09]|nr:hypothetical protein AD006_22845 [Pseudonocardia sp. EC080610-09]ALL84201.1 hypothetical protein AD017_02435 [Pseudonocardia sp. EC080619-01]